MIKDCLSTLSLVRMRRPTPECGTSSVRTAAAPEASQADRQKVAQAHTVTLVGALRAQHGQVCIGGRPYFAYETLLQATQAYFAEPPEYNAARDGSPLREAGFERIDEARMRLFARMPLAPEHPLHSALEDLRQFCAQLARECLHDVALSLGMASDAVVALGDFEAGSIEAPSESILRVFQYEPQQGEAAGPTVITDAHRDLGLLAIGLRSAPGLQGFAGASGWRAWERNVSPDVPMVMAGRSLALITRGAIPSCMHRVVAAPTTRLSWVYHLRLRPDVLLERSRLDTPKLDPLFDELDGMRGGALTCALYQSSYNVNAPPSARKTQQKPFDQRIFERVAAERTQRMSRGLASRAP